MAYSFRFFGLVCGLFFICYCLFHASGQCQVDQAAPSSQELSILISFIWMRLYRYALLYFRQHSDRLIPYSSRIFLAIPEILIHLREILVYLWIQWKRRFLGVSVSR